MNLVYKNEQPLFLILLIISLLVWTGLLIGTKGQVLAYVLSFALFFLFAQSAFISYLRGTAVKITSQQFPDLHDRIVDCCHKLGLTQVPDAYLLHVGGTFNALATRFLGRNFIVLFSDVVDALEDHPDALNFYIGHEIGHLKRGHLRWAPLLSPASMLPLIGAAYARAREYTCDRHGLAACDNMVSAQVGLTVLAAGGKRWRTIDGDGYVSQTRDSSGFWMSFHELLSDYPWLTKRVAAMQAMANGGEIRQPGRNPLAWIPALFIPRFGTGAGPVSGLITIAMIGILAAIALPAYQEYTVRAKMATAVSVGRQAAAAVGNYYRNNKEVPATLEAAGFSLPAAVSGVSSVTVNPTNGVVEVRVAIPPHAGKSIALAPYLDDSKQIRWHCGSREIDPKFLPQDCRD
jgi:Zn-dependent protease with chaperone function